MHKIYKTKGVLVTQNKLVTLQTSSHSPGTTRFPGNASLRAGLHFASPALTVLFLRVPLKATQHIDPHQSNHTRTTTCFGHAGHWHDPCNPCARPCWCSARPKPVFMYPMAQLTHSITLAKCNTSNIIHNQGVYHPHRPRTHFIFTQATPSTSLKVQPSIHSHSQSYT